MVVNALIISLKISAVSIMLSSVIGILLARLLYKKTSIMAKIIENILLLPIFLPPSIVGYMLLITFGRNGAMGKLITQLFDTGIIFTWYAGVLATFVMSLPLIYQNSKSAFLSVDFNCEEAAKVDGASKLQILFKITLPMAVRGLLCGIILGFARAFGEFGATLMIAGNIPGKTQTLPMAMYYAVEGGNRPLANQIFILVLIISTLLILSFNYLSRKAEY